MKRLLLLLLLLLALPAFAVEPSEQLKDPQQEKRAREISRQLRCVVCQNESIDSSNADIARDLRLAVRERIRAGDDDEAVIAWVRQRYGDFVLLQPPLNASTAPLWFGPPGLLLIAIIALALRARRVRPAEPAPLTPEEARRLAALERDL
ncbi:cytochrome c-type biogenesis protein [Roseiterribacter gracilis]|uniref:Cytochrome c-type biogenesis protein n=1 Tax=Roseiterribacter gracilis TaxID=2812848 RepID=A0A8S8XE91_9PROT|nr:cytochrome c-type biogenesis protein CcmH [Rhodospirillales bacterium TMPK1]